MEGVKSRKDTQAHSKISTPKYINVNTKTIHGMYVIYVGQTFVMSTTLV